MFDTVRAAYLSIPQLPPNTAPGLSTCHTPPTLFLSHAHAAPLEDVAEHQTTTGVNGTSYIVGGGAAAAIAKYPHMRRVNGYLHVSGTSSRRADNTHVGATKKKDGSFELDIEAQVRTPPQTARRPQPQRLPQTDTRNSTHAHRMPAL